jgi:hypothetical protein
MRPEPLSARIEQIVLYVPPDPHVRAIERDYYQRLDVEHLYRSAFTLYQSLQEPASLARFFAADPAALTAIDEGFAASLIAEIHLAELRLTEGLFALLMAAFQLGPHPVFLATCKSGTVRAGIRQFLAGDMAGFTGGRRETVGEMVSAAIYCDYLPPNLEAEWARNIANITDVLETAGGKCDQAGERRSYFRGLGLKPAEDEDLYWMEPAGLALADAGEAEEEGCGDAVNYLEIRRAKGKKYPRLFEMSRKISLEESINLIYCMTLLSRTIRSTRLARLKGETTAELHSLASVDIDALRRLHADSLERVRVGRVMGTDIR